MYLIRHCLECNSIIPKHKKERINFAIVCVQQVLIIKELDGTAMSQAHVKIVINQNAQHSIYTVQLNVLL